MDIKSLLEAFAVKTAEELQKAKTTGPQRWRALGGSMAGDPVRMTADECKSQCDAIGCEYLPGYEARVLPYTISNETADRYGDIVRVAGIDMTQYNKNPVVCYCHQHDEMPVGKSLRTWIDGQTAKAHGLFLDERVDTSGRASLVFKFASSGFLPGCSIGFLPTDVYAPSNAKERNQIGLGSHGVEYRRSELLEWSPCAIPANPDALQGASLKSIGKDDLTLAERFKLFDPNLIDILSTKLGKTISVPVDTSDILVAVKELRLLTEAHINATQKIADQFLADMKTLRGELATLKALPPTTGSASASGVKSIYAHVFGRPISFDTQDQKDNK